ncbi:MAG: phospholipase D-like domain-containing protein, partial [Myxococcota bacterium]
MTKSPVRLLSILLALVGCASESASSPDSENAVAVPGGKADDLSHSPCTVGAVVDLLNDPDITADSLRAGGLHTRAANNIVQTRLGPDGQRGTDDDVFFADIVEVDDVPWVGPVALEQLTAMAPCEPPSGEGSADVIFSPQPFERSHLARAVELIDGAEESLDVAMYSMSNSDVIEALGRAAARGISIRMIFHPAQSERRDPEGTRSGRLEAAGIDVRYINKIMHHKFVLVDGPRGNPARTSGWLMTGSGNWSNSAGNRYDENALIIEGHAELMLRYQREFDLLWDYSRDFEGQAFEQLHVDPIGQGVIDANDDADVEAYFTSANFRTTESARWGRGFSLVGDRGIDEVADQLVRLIENARSSIRIASGHLRSRPVAEALIAAVERNPDLDVRIYTDAKEFISASSHARQVENRQECLEEATTDNQRQQCYDVGFLYG